MYCAENDLNKLRSGDHCEKCLAKFLHANVTLQVKQISVNPYKSENVLSRLNFLRVIFKLLRIYRKGGCSLQMKDSSCINNWQSVIALELRRPLLRFLSLITINRFLSPQWDRFLLITVVWSSMSLRDLETFMKNIILWRRFSIFLKGNCINCKHNYLSFFRKTRALN